MRKRTKRWIEAYTKRGGRRQAWKKFVQVMACIVVFCTTYAMILPAITLEQSYDCRLAEHTHTDACLDAQGAWVCGMPEHAHSDDCISDPNADVEHQEQWDAQFGRMEFTGEWSSDLLTVAKTQLGYTESRQNFEVRTDLVRRGYTRYGQWYGAPYKDWNAMFVSFCLSYAQVPRRAIPWDSDSEIWMSDLEAMSLLDTPAARTPEPGELVFFLDHDGQTLLTGIVSNVEVHTNPDTGEQRAALLRIIAGDCDGQVAELYVTMDRVLASCSMESARQRYAELYPGKQEHEPAATEPTGAPATEPAQMLSQTAETENYIVVVTYSSALELPAEAVLKAMEYPKDSEIFRRRCAEAGYELEWLMNIGFFVDEQELELSGAFDVQVISKAGDQLGQDITHFAEDGVERIDGTATDEGTEDGQTAVAFPAGGFSDFGGGIATMAETGTTKLTVVDPNSLADGAEYVIFIPYGRNYLAMGNNGFSTVNVGTGSTPAVGTEFELTAGTSLSGVTWRLEKVTNSSNFVLYSTATGQRLHINDSNLNAVDWDCQLGVSNISGASARLGFPWRSGWSSGTNYLRYSDGWTGTNSTYRATQVYFAVEKNYPHAVHTGTYEVGSLRFYNFCEGPNGEMTALAGCEFLISGTTLDGQPYEKTVFSGDISEITFMVPDGDYTITQISAPEGYFRDDDHQKTFKVRDGKFFEHAAIGFFMNHRMDTLHPSKTAHVSDYANRIYEVRLAAQGKLQTYEMDPVDVVFVVDKSNSMLFPSGLNPVTYGGETVTVTLDKTGANNVENLERLAAEGKINKDEMYYIVSDPHGSATVWCVWHDGENWLYQDASYYAKAKHENADGYKQGDHTVVFPNNQAFAKYYGDDPDGKGSLTTNGGGMGFAMTDSGIAADINKGNNVFAIYQATGEFNRLHYLEEALSNMVLELAEMNPLNTVTLVPFTSKVNEADCSGQVVLNTTDNVNSLLAQIRDINTDGGTRQDIALKHVYNQHLSKDPYKENANFVVLITDGAPAGTTNLGKPENVDEYAENPNDESGKVYPLIRSWAKTIRETVAGGKETNLMTVALGMNDVEGGKMVLDQIATGYPDGDMYCALDDAAALVDRIQQLIFSNMRPDERISFHSDVTDVVSNSFYPVAWVPKGTAPAGRTVLDLEDPADLTKDWIILQPEDWITADGRYTTGNDRAGQIQQNDKGEMYVTWSDLDIGDGWNGKLFIKAKEDFIGGNVINTNKEARIKITYPEEVVDDAALPVPAVHVRLLNMNEMSSEVTVYLGDTINEPGNAPLDSLKYFYHNMEITKLISGDGSILNKPYTGELPEGLSEDKFTLFYAIGRDLTEDEWEKLMLGEEVTVEYTYDSPSSTGPVGKFTFKLEKVGSGTYDEHVSTTACQTDGASTESCNSPVETYYLHVTYDAYKVGTENRPGPERKLYTTPGESPGIHVGDGQTLPTGLGTVSKTHIHEVHVISGKVTIIKEIATELISAVDQSFTFSITLPDGTTVQRTVTVKAGETTGSITLADLSRGTYTVTEAVDADSEYAMESLAVQSGTNCQNSGDGTIVTFVMGHNTKAENVIGKVDDDRYTSYTDPPNGTLGVVKCRNIERVYEGQVPVVKVWDDGAENHTRDTVYVALYAGENPVLDAQNRVRLLKLDATNNWAGSFTVVLANATDKVENYGYSVREVSGISTSWLYGWQAAVVEGTDTVLYYEKAVAEGGTLGFNGNGYIVAYTPGANDSWTVTNHRGYELPETGGMGTSHLTFGGLLMTAAALMYICITGHKRRKGGR